MIKICCRYAADIDGAGIIYNNAMLRVFKNIGAYKEEGKLMGWIKTIVVNCALDFVKQQERFKEQAIDVIDEDSISISAEALHNVSAKEISILVRTLPKATATVFNLYIYEGYKHAEIGELLNISAGTSKWHLNEARRLLKTKLEKSVTPVIHNHAAGK